MRRGLLHLAALAACLAAGCGREAPKEAVPLRIVSTSAAATHILLALGAEEELAAMLIVLAPIYFAASSKLVRVRVLFS